MMEMVKRIAMKVAGIPNKKSDVDTSMFDDCNTAEEIEAKTAKLIAEMKEQHEKNKEELFEQHRANMFNVRASIVKEEVVPHWLERRKEKCKGENN